MAKITLFPLLVLISAGAVRVQSYDHFWLVQTWPPGYCSQRNCRNTQPTPRFILHGLWPVNSTGHVSNQNNTNISKVQSPIANVTQLLGTSKAHILHAKMQQDWPGLTRRDIWEHEWGSHGRFQSLLKGIAYFNKTVELFQKTNLLDTLNRGNVKPNSSYSADSYRNVIGSKYSTPILRCIVKNNNNLLTELILCVDGPGIIFINCSATQEKDGPFCRNSILFPASVI